MPSSLKWKLLESWGHPRPKTTNLEDRASSDMDFLVEFERGRSLLDLAGLRVELSEALGREVDVATRNSLHPSPRDRIIRELVPLL